ncbi:MAG: DNA primase [Sphingomonadaceae bacterium]
MTLSPQWLDELRARTVLSTLIGRTIKVSKAGREYKACCPFHNEKTPSFTINDDKGFYHCFGCSAHGDAIRWMTDQRGLPFIDAVKELAQAAGMDVPASDPGAAERSEKANSLYDVMTAATDWFAEQLQSLAGAEARGYLARRGLNAATIQTFGLGFAPDSRSKLKAALARFGDAQLVEAGLLIAVDDKEPYDRFRGRLMIPIRDARGRVIAFGGRILGSGEPKYLNSPDTPLFDKGRTLYNLDLAGPASRKTNRIIVVEGYMDVIALAQVGVEDVVAPLGTALTEHQLERLWRLADVPLLCLDGDSAGQKAALRAALRALPMLAPSKSLGFATLPAGLDPDDLVRTSGVQALTALLAKPEPLVDRIWSAEVQAEPLTTPEQRAGLRQRLSQHSFAIADENVRSQYQAEFRDRFDALFQRSAPRPRDKFVPGKRSNFGRPVFERPVSSGARSIGGGGVEPMIARAIMAGLLRFPATIRASLEPLSALVIADEALDRLRILLIDAAYDYAVLDSEALMPICQQAGLGEVASGVLGTSGLAFSFASRHADAELAQRDLGMAIEALAARPALDAALAAATARLGERWDETGFAEQRRLLEARQAADQKLAELVSRSDEDETGKQI